MTPEQKARVSIDALLVAAGWHVCNVADVRLAAVAFPPSPEPTRIVVEVDRHIFIIHAVEAEVDANLQRAQALRQATLAKTFT